MGRPIRSALRLSSGSSPLPISCAQAVQSGVDLWPSESIASSEVPHHPGLVQWLAMADAKQCDALVDSCLAQLTALSNDSKAMPILREALASPSLSPMLEGLRSETLIKAMRLMVGLPVLKVKSGPPLYLVVSNEMHVVILMVYTSGGLIRPPC